jgi:hypothetical protein
MTILSHSVIAGSSSMASTRLRRFEEAEGTVISLPTPIGQFSLAPSVKTGPRFVYLPGGALRAAR